MPVAENHHSAWKQSLRRLSGPLLLVLIVVLFHWKLVLTNQYTWLESPDLVNQVLPWFEFQAAQWHSGHFPLWEPAGWGGQPLIGQAQPGAAYPLNWLLFLAPLNNGWIRQISLHWYYVLIHVLAALTMYALARDLKRSKTAAILAGCVYALGGYVAHTDWPQMVNGAVWAPLAFLYMFRAERDERPIASSVLSGFFLGIIWLSGHHQMPLFLTLAVAGTWGWLIVRGKRIDWRIAKFAVISLAIAVLTSAFQTIPTAEYGRRAVRWAAGADPLRFDQVVPYSVHGQYALKPIGLLGVFVPNIEQSPSDPYVGVVALTLAIAGVMLGWRERWVRWLTMIALGGILFALGPNSLLHGVLYAIAPLVEKARVPAAATVVFAVGLAPLAAFGLDSLVERSSVAWSRRAGWVLAVLGGVLALASLIFYAARVPVQISDDRLMITALACILLAAVFAGWRAGHMTLAAVKFACVGLVVFELANVTDYWLPQIAIASQNRFLHKLAENDDIAAYIFARGEPGRMAYDDTEIPYDFGDWYGLDAWNNSGPSVITKTWDTNVFSDNVENFFGIRYYLGKKPNHPDQKALFTGRNGVIVFENPKAFPRAWSVHQVTHLDDPGQAKWQLADPAFDARQKAFLVNEAAPTLENCDPSSDLVSLDHQEPNRVKINATLACRGMVILSDTWFPGWRATVDGKSAQIYAADGVVRGVVVDRGTHVIVMHYLPWSVMLGGIMTLAAMGIVIFAVRRREE